MTLKELREEYNRPKEEGGFIGPNILGEVDRAVDILVRRYDPQIYGGVANWRDGKEDLVQGIVTDLLLGEGQLDFIFSQATTLDDFRGLLFFQAKRYLARKRRRTVIDNLLDRCDEIVSEHPFASMGGDPARYRLDDATRENRLPGESELAEVARYASVIPRIPFAVSERAPIVYSRENLAKLLLVVADRLPCAFSKRDLHHIFEFLLTDWVPSFLEEVEEDQAHTGELRPEDEVQVNETSTRIMAELAADEAVIFRAQILRLPDQTVADELGTSRQTVIARRKRLFERLQPILSDLPEQLQMHVIERVGLSLTLPQQEASE